MQKKELLLIDILNYARLYFKLTFLNFPSIYSAYSCDFYLVAAAGVGSDGVLVEVGHGVVVEPGDDEGGDPVAHHHELLLPNGLDDLVPELPSIIP